MQIKISIVSVHLISNYQGFSVLPMRFCERVGFFLGTDNATAEGGTSLGGSGGMLPRKIFKISMQIELFYSILGNNSLYFHF